MSDKLSALTSFVESRSSQWNQSQMTNSQYNYNPYSSSPRDNYRCENYLQEEQDYKQWWQADE
jgi:hypothetical protein